MDQEETSWAISNYKHPTFGDPTPSTPTSTNSRTDFLGGSNYIDLAIDFQNKHPLDQAGNQENPSAIKMQTMTMQSVREFMAMGTSYGIANLASDPALNVNNLEQQYSLINEGHAYLDHVSTEPKLPSSLYANNFNLMGEEPIVAPPSSVGTTTGTLVDHPSLILQNLSTQLYNSAASEMMVSASTDQRIPYRTQLQRESHILAERQRREEMNEKFTILRSMIPKLTKKDKASIVTDTINYIRELEKTVSYLQACKKKSTAKTHLHVNGLATSSSKPSLVDPSIRALPFGRCLNNNETSEARQKITDPISSVTGNHEESPFLSINTRDPFAQHERYCDDQELRRVKLGQVEIENLGGQAVVKVLSKRGRGVVLRLHLALEECKVDVIQSNVTTIGNNMVHYITIGINPGISKNLDELVAALQIAATLDTLGNVELS